MNYREVKCSDRLPEQEKDNHGELLRFTIPYHLITGSNIRTVGYYDYELKQWFAEDYPESTVESWLEPYELPTEEEIKKAWKQYYAIGSELKFHDGYMLYHGFTDAITNLLKGER